MSTLDYLKENQWDGIVRNPSLPYPNESQKAILRSLSQWKGVSFPNGSNYSKEILPIGSFLGGRVEISYSKWLGYVCYIDGKKCKVPSQRSDRPGSRGIRYGIEYCTRDQCLSYLLPGV